MADTLVWRALPEGTFRTSGEGADNQSFTISDVTPTLAGCTFKGWSSDTWENKDAGGNPVLFQPGNMVSNVKSDTVLTAVWEPTEAANTHTVSFMADVSGVSQLPAAKRRCASGRRLRLRPRFRSVRVMRLTDPGIV